MSRFTAGCGSWLELRSGSGLGRSFHASGGGLDADEGIITDADFTAKGVVKRDDEDKDQGDGGGDEAGDGEMDAEAFGAEEVCVADGDGPGEEQNLPDDSGQVLAGSLNAVAAGLDQFDGGLHHGALVDGLAESGRVEGG